MGRNGWLKSPSRNSRAMPSIWMNCAICGKVHRGRFKELALETWLDIGARYQIHDAVLLLEEAEELLRDPRHGSVYKDYWDKVHAWFAKVRAK